MNKNFKPIFMTAVLAVFGVVNAQEAAEAAENDAAVQPAVEAPAPEAIPATVTAEAPAPEVISAPVAEPAPIAVEAPAATPIVIAPAPEAANDDAVAPQADTSTVVLLVKEPQPKKKRRSTSKRDFAVVDIPANFEIQARKVMPVDSDGWPEDNLNEWWGRANLMVLTESENFIGKIHLRMYPGDFRDPTVTVYSADCPDNTCNKGGWYNNKRDVIELHEAWAWHRGNYFNLKIGRWDNTTRFGNMAYGGYIDAKKDKYIDSQDANRNSYRRAEGFLSTFYPENALQFGFNNFSENISLDLALISRDMNLNRGDLRAYFHFKDLSGIESMDIGIGYRANVFDGIYDGSVDITHTVSLGFRLPIVKDVGLLKNLSLFGETAFIGLDDQEGKDEEDGRGRLKASEGRTLSPLFPILGGFEISFYRGLDKIVIEAEYDSERVNKVDKENPQKNVKDVLGSIYVQKKLNDRFTLDLGVQSENNTKDFSLAARLQGRIN